MTRYRYYQHRCGEVRSVVPGQAQDAVFSTSDDWTEVQVIPLDAVVIRREELPEVVWKPFMKRWETVPDDRGIWAASGADPAYFEARAQEYAAMARHLREHPPVDEEQVKELARDLARGEVITNEAAWNTLLSQARPLVRAGWTKAGDAPC